MATRLAKTENPAIYLYGITERELSPGRIPGVDGASPVETLPCAGLVCWISRVSRAEFADNLPSHMENLDWLAEASVQHQRVVSAIARLADVLPARFGTVFLSEASLQADIEAKKRILKKDFAKINGSDEFGVKVFGVLPAAALPKISARTGKDYLNAKAALLQRKPARNPASDAEFQQLKTELEGIAVDMAQPGNISGGQRGLQWQTTLLLRRPDRKKFEAILRRFSRQWAGAKQIECTGPWPPYSFVSRTERG